MALAAASDIGAIFTAIRQTVAILATVAVITPAVGAVTMAAAGEAATAAAAVKFRCSKWRRWKAGSSRKASAS